MVQDLVLRELREKGFSVVYRLSTLQVARVDAHLRAAPVFVDAHVPQSARNRGDVEVLRGSARDRASECVCVLNDHVTTAPYLFEIALLMTDVAAAYLGRDPPRLYSTNAFWTRPGQAALRGDIQAFHKDADDARFLAMFVYLTDVVDDDDGPHDLYGPDGAVRTIKGPAGTIFLADTSREHRGRKPRSRERGLLWFRWGVSDRPPAGQWDKVQPIPAAALGDRYPSDPRLRESVQLVVSPP